MNRSSSISTTGFIITNREGGDNLACEDQCCLGDLLDIVSGAWVEGLIGLTPDCLTRFMLLAMLLKHA